MCALGDTEQNSNKEECQDIVIPNAQIDDIFKFLMSNQSPKLKHIHFRRKYNTEKQQILKFEKLAPEKVCHLYMTNDLNY